ncbi:hypothetical protein M407DRAFT_221649 [Tulasnella calospora MUT 4182]|uniref:SWR1-complex protein 4 n=1 Tax=Tulasnella calospora MUT 4182 TaxID=1051891 RepID=A0A0C3QR39_9AGAM|nr:hypothetical protein M407DRAFT_221649 [Tulasnella calospora MUT 4182]
MATAADVRDILNLPQNPLGTKNVAKKTPQTRKEAGITRELYQLIGDSAPTLVAQYARPKLKAKPELGRPKVKWEWKEFQHSNRADALAMHHWTKTSPAQPEEEYPFAKYSNIPPIAYEYSSEEYSRLLEDPDWSREETDYLFALVKEYDVRFFVIYDRYDFPEGKPRSMQDLKARYYHICRKLIKSRPFAGDEQTKNQVMSSYSYDKVREDQRRNYLNGLFSRTPAQIAEEEALYIECKRIEQNERRFQRERDDLLRTLAGMESGLASLSLRVDDPTNSLPPLNIGSRPRVPRRSDGMELDSPVANNNMIAMPSPYSGPSSLPGTGGRQKSGSVSGGATPKQPLSISLSSAPAVPETSFDPVHCLTQPTAPLTTSSLTTKTHKPVHFRSSLIPQPKSSLKQKVNAAIQEMGVHPERLVMPTAANLEKLEGLQAAAGGLLDMKKALDRVEQEIRINKARLRGGSEAGETDADGTGETDRGRTDREGSIASLEPSGNRQKRSASVVSSAASAAPDVRPRKRQRP